MNRESSEQACHMALCMPDRLGPGSAIGSGPWSARNDEDFISVSQPHYADHMAKVINLQSEIVARIPFPPETSVSKHKDPPGGRL